MNQYNRKTKIKTDTASQQLVWLNLLLKQKPLNSSAHLLNISKHFTVTVYSVYVMQFLQTVESIDENNLHLI